MNELKPDLRHFLYLWDRDSFLHCSLTYLISPFFPWLSGRQNFKIKLSYFSKRFTSGECLWAGAAAWLRQQVCGISQKGKQGAAGAPRMCYVTLGEVLNLQVLIHPGFPSNTIEASPNKHQGTVCLSCVPATFLPFPRKLHLEAGRQGLLTLLLEASVSAH